MDRQQALKHLAQAEEHIAASAKHIARQREIILELEEDGRDNTEAEALLMQFEQLEAMHVAHRDRLRGALGYSVAQ